MRSFYNGGSTVSLIIQAFGSNVRIQLSFSQSWRSREFLCLVEKVAVLKYTWSRTIWGMANAVPGDESLAARIVCAFYKPSKKKILRS